MLNKYDFALTKLKVLLYIVYRKVYAITINYFKINQQRKNLNRGLNYEIVSKI